MSFDLGAIGRPGEPHRYDVTEEALRAYAQATGGAPPARCSRSCRRGRRSPPPRGRSPPTTRGGGSSTPPRTSTCTRRSRPACRWSPPRADRDLRAAQRRRAGHPRGDPRRRAARGRAVRHRAVPRAGGRRGPRRAGARRSRGRARGRATRGAPSRWPADQAERYAEASGDHNPIHLDEEAARAVGLPGRILHGLCTMALAGRAVEQVAGREPTRLAVRFSAPVALGADGDDARVAATSRSRRRPARPRCSRAAGPSDRRHRRDRLPHARRARAGRPRQPAAAPARGGRQALPRRAPAADRPGGGRPLPRAAHDGGHLPGRPRAGDRAAARAERGGGGGGRRQPGRADPVREHRPGARPRRASRRPAA